MGDLLQILSNPTIVSLVVGGVLGAWHLITRKATSGDSTFAHTLDAARSVAQSIVQTIAPTATPDELAAKVLSATNKLLTAANINPTSTLATAAINAVVHDAVQSFLAKDPAPAPTASPALHAAIVNLSLNPPAQAA